MKKGLFAALPLSLCSILFAPPAQAELKLHLGGYFKGYGVYVDEDAAVAGQRDFEFRKSTEIHFTGEALLENGLTVGVHVEQLAELNNSNNESYVYFSGSWGRVIFGNEDGAAYLLQVAAPSADSNVDGLRTYIRGFNSLPSLDYDHAQGYGMATSENFVDRITYLTPKFNGLQFGLSYAPEVDKNAGIAPMGGAGGFESAYELAARWDFNVSAFDISFGGGFSRAENDALPPPAQDIMAWNAGLHVARGNLSLGLATLYEEGTFVVNSEAQTWVVGAAWDQGPYHLGASYLWREDESLVTLKSHKATIGGGYTFAPGMSFRAAFMTGDTFDLFSNADDFTQITLGTDISF